MSKNTCIKIKSAGIAQLVHDAPIPKLKDDYILVKTAAVALNPTDWKHIDEMATPGATVGCDYSGIVQEVGPAVSNGLKPGDRVAGLVHGSNASNLEDGAFGDYIIAKGNIQMKIPEGVSFEEAAAIGVGAITAGQHLFQNLRLPLPTRPSQESVFVLVYGGSTATGTMAIQLAKLSGLTVVTTCSPRNFDLVRDLGADHVFDYNSPDAVSLIKEVTEHALRYALDTVASEVTARFCCDVLGKEGGRYSSVLPIPKLPRKDIVNLSSMAFTAIGEAFEIAGQKVPARPDDFVFAADFIKLVEEVWSSKKLSVHPFEVRSGGFDGIFEGLQEMREGKISGRKLVYSV
ncbi:chaperonin 10-like protein [Penicillium subrubescens]|uniref:Protein TOXD n=1 Tax=Penicillium subrubescens TaxID=1316194 RepID=A0A1Q5UEI4_9EURO|nr:chaperonin 10-like protein [Penicillium subrubescens]KAJ5896890.1 chaperonin 10-like protein [Penicillium subrubescens]OKP10879.1 Protein TOXD [Penicillium subrubescens]